MCLPLTHAPMANWLRTQLIVIDAWREELARAPELDLDMIRRVEAHRDWLAQELTAMEAAVAA